MNHSVAIIFALLALSPIAPLAAQGAPPRVATLTGPTMGTAYHIKYWGKGEASLPAVKAEVDRLLATFDQQMSTYRDDSELARFNRAPAGVWFPVSADTARVVDESLGYFRETGGVLDVTVPPVLRLWNFGGGAKSAGRGTASFKPPTDAQVTQALTLVGSGQLQARVDSPALKKEIEGLEVDLSSIAPGYAVDLIVRRLHELGFANVMVEIGGEVRATGVRADGTPWRIGVERVGATDGTLARVVPLHDMALSTAGDYRNFQGADGERYTHIIDPRTGRALPYRGAAVTVIAPTCTEADALDTPLLVMGIEAGYDWCVEHKVAALFQERQATGDDGRGGRTFKIIERATPQFIELVGSN